MAKRVCPFWVGYLLISPLRALMQNSKKILSQYITSGMKVLDVGCGMEFFSLPITIVSAQNNSFKAINHPQIWRSRTVLLKKVQIY